MPRQPHNPLPAAWRLVIAEMNGRFYPLNTGKPQEDGTITLDTCSHLLWSMENQRGIPYALGPQPTQGVISFRTYAQAYAFCERYQEHFTLWSDWQRLAAGCELYPERNVWYREQIKTLGGYLLHCEALCGFVYCCVFLPNEIYWYVTAPTIDEAIAQLYQQVYDRVTCPVPTRERFMS
jgi:hypothetical protein